MTQERARFFVGVGSIFIQDGNVLTVFRNNTERNNNKHGLIGGLVHAGESVRAAAVRIIFEEVGLDVDPEDLTLIHVMSSRENGEETVGHYFLVEDWDGEPVNKASHKHARIEWVDLNELPATLIERNRQALENMFEEIPYSEYGW